ncbi:hypothetical protein HF325_000661 [Metschnikowia pulcherrima]|uniref:Uncharacterized protein n=1 Tax=Metschnikowia pulcherrima TaxID=27326 RepID=A0A8H7LE59_9ASCO|nr:hypothetical protein HF325_000661 [Metschnikowia pulcherrima]
MTCQVLLPEKVSNVTPLLSPNSEYGIIVTVKEREIDDHFKAEASFLRKACKKHLAVVLKLICYARHMGAGICPGDLKIPAKKQLCSENITGSDSETWKSLLAAEITKLTDQVLDFQRDVLMKNKSCRVECKRWLNGICKARGISGWDDFELIRKAFDKYYRGRIIDYFLLQALDFHREEHFDIIAHMLRLYTKEEKTLHEIFHNEIPDADSGPHVDVNFYVHEYYRDRLEKLEAEMKESEFLLKLMQEEVDKKQLYRICPTKNKIPIPRSFAACCWESQRTFLYLYGESRDTGCPNVKKEEVLSKNSGAN